MNLGTWKRAIGRPVNITHNPTGAQCQGYLKEVRVGRWLVIDVPLPRREEWRRVIDRHSTEYTFELA